jgi:ABC-type amino acid transport system permease subunit
MEVYEDSDVEDFKPNRTTALAWTVVLTILGMCAGLLVGILYGGYVLVNLIIKLMP